MACFRILLHLHTPLILPSVVPRLDTLLHEAACRLTQSWGHAHDLPLTFDTQFQAYRASQVIFGTTHDQPMMADQHICPSSPEQLERDQLSDSRRFREDGGGFVRRLSQHRAYLSPYLLFYGDGDPDRCVELLQLMDGIGREHGRSAGSFTVGDVMPDSDRQWRWRSAPASISPAELPYASIRTHQRLTAGGAEMDTVSPPRVVREVIE